MNCDKRAVSGQPPYLGDWLNDLSIIQQLLYSPSTDRVTHTATKPICLDQCHRRCHQPLHLSGLSSTHFSPLVCFYIKPADYFCPNATWCFILFLCMSYVELSGEGLDHVCMLSDNHVVPDAAGAWFCGSSGECFCYLGKGVCVSVCVSVLGGGGVTEGERGLHSV